MAATMAETSALAALTATEQHLKDAEAEVERSTAAKSRNDRDIADRQRIHFRGETSASQSHRGSCIRQGHPGERRRQTARRRLLAGCAIHRLCLE